MAQSHIHSPTFGFGPWATTLDAGTSAGLSTFWKKRMAMLAPTRKTLPGVSPRAILPLLLAAAATLAAPTFYLSPAPAAPPESSNNAEAATNSTAPDVPKKETEAADNAIAGRPAPQAGQPVRVELPGGGILELVAIGEHPSKDRPWWAPDGTSTAAPYDDFGGRSHAENEIGREFAIRWIKEPNNGVTAWWTINGNGSGSAGGTARGPGGKPIGGLQASAVLFRKETMTCSISINVATAPWTTQAETDGLAYASGSTYRGSKKTSFMFTPAFASEGKLILTVGHTIFDQDIRIVALDQGGKIVGVDHSGGGGVHEFRQTTAKLENLALTDVNKFELQSRPYERFEIRDISLWPDEKTEPKVVNVDDEQREQDKTQRKDAQYRQRFELLDKGDYPVHGKVRSDGAPR